MNELKQKPQKRYEKPKKNSCKKWSQEDVDYLLDNYSKGSFLEMSEKLGRTISAIKRKVETELKTRNRLVLEGYLSTVDFGEIFGVSAETVYDWITTRKLPAKKFKKDTNNPNSKNGSFVYGINPNLVWKWLSEAKEKKMIQISTSQIKLGYIVPEPAWLLEDIKNKVWYGNGEPWSEEKLAELYVCYFKNNMSYGECEEKFNRTYNAIRYQIFKMRNMKTSDLKKLLNCNGIWDI